ncbi:MAG: helix-turn-helix domain-containing protein [Pseudomonadota bacterium]
MRALVEASIPSFRLYGEAQQTGLPDLIHVETLKDRSQHHDWRIQPHRHHDLFQIMHFQTTDVGVELDGATTRVPAPAVLFVPPRVVHGFHFSPKVSGTVTTIPIEGLQGDDLLLSMTVAPLLLRGGNRPFERLSGLIDDLHDEYRGHRPERRRALQTLLELIMVWGARGRAETLDQISPLAEQQKSEKRVSEFLALVEQHFTEGWHAGDYARAVGTSKSQLTRDCRSMAGRSPLQIVHDRLVQEANRKLAYTPWPISQISEALGFTDLGYFSRFYRERTGETPSRYRARIRARTVQGATQATNPPPSEDRGRKPPTARSL